jgi:uncharacterized ferredoxin-like protein
MMTAARTAPKGHGTDNLIIAVAERDVIETIAAKMKDMVQTGEAAAFFDRDANNILQSEIMVLLATKIKPLGLKNCGLCGFIDCREKEEHPEHPCAFNTGDLGIAVGGQRCDGRAGGQQDHVLRRKSRQSAQSARRRGEDHLRHSAERDGQKSFL